MDRSFIPLFLASLTLASCQASSSTDGVEVVRGGPACEACRLERTLVATINDAAYPDGALGSFAQVQVNSDGTFLVVTGPGMSQDGVYLADQSGSIHTRIGREGEGPGEYRFPEFTMESDTSYLVVDEGLQRLTSFSKRDLSVEWDQHIPVRVSGIPPVEFPDGTWLMPTHSGGEDLDWAGSINVISPEGELVRTFKVGLDSISSERDYIGFLSVAGDREFWVSFSDKCRLEKWDLEGNLVTTVERESDWIRPRTEDSRDGDLYTRIKAAVEDETRRLWIHYELNRVDIYERSAVKPDGSPTTITIRGSSRAVSYTHLRAHET